MYIVLQMYSVVVGVGVEWTGEWRNNMKSIEKWFEINWNHIFSVLGCFGKPAKGPPLAVNFFLRCSMYSTSCRWVSVKPRMLLWHWSATWKIWRAPLRIFEDGFPRFLKFTSWILLSPVDTYSIHSYLILIYIDRLIGSYRCITVCEMEFQPSSG